MSALGTGTRSMGTHRALSATLRLGALYDLAFAFLMVAAPGALARGFELPLPGEAFYLRLLAVLLAMLAAMYWIAAADPQAHRSFVGVAIVGRLLGFLALGYSALGRPELAGLWCAALGDLAFAVVTFVAARRLLLS